MRKWIVAVGTALGIAFGVILLFFGFFLLIGGLQTSFFGPLLMIFGGPMIAAGIVVVLTLVEARYRKWVIAARIASSATLIFVGLVFLIWSFFFASRIGVMLNPATLLFGGFGGSMLAAGIIVVLRLFEARKRKWVIAARIASSATLIFVGLVLISGGLWGYIISLIIGGSMIAAGIITLLRTVR